MPRSLPDTQLLVASSAGSPTWVRVTITIGTPLDLGSASVAEVVSRRLNELAAGATSAIPVSPTVAKGGTVLGDFRIKRTLRVQELKREFELLLFRILPPFSRATVRDVQALDVGDLSEATAPERREKVIVEAEQSRAEAATTVGSVVGAVADVGKFLRGLAVVVVVGVVVVAGFPLIRTGAQALARTRKKRRRRSATTKKAGT